MRADRADDRYSGFHQFVAQVKDLSYAGVHVLVFHGFADTDRHGFQVTAGQSSVGVETFIYDHHISRFLEDIFLIGGQKTPDIDHGVFLGAHGCAVRERAYLKDDLGNALFLIAFFVQLYHVGILGNAGHIVDNANTVPLGQFAKAF